MRSPGVGAQITGMPTTIGTATTFTATTTFNKTAEASAAESILVAKISDDSVGQINFRNASATDAQLVPVIRLDSASTSTGGWWQTRITSDSGSNPAAFYDVRTIAGGAISNRVLYRWSNNGTTVLDGLPLNSGANLALSWGTQAAAAPTFTTRSAGVRAIWYSAIGATQVDFATGVGASNQSLYHSIPQATSTYSHKWFGGTTEIASLRGDGLLTTSGGQVHAARVATTSPVTVATTDYVIATKLTVPGAVTVNLPGSQPAGRVYIIQDATGDAAANNITIVPAAGNINGAANLVINANYGAKELVYTGSEWIAR